MQIVIVLVAASGFASLLLTGVIRNFALRNEVLDRPNARSSHSVPTPRGGGAAVIVASALGVGVSALLGLVPAREALSLTCGMLLLGVTGWTDDRIGVRASVRLAIHFAVALWTVYMLGGLPSVHIGNSSVTLGLPGYLLGTLGIVWSINLFNFMDGIDGLAGSQALIIFSAIAVALYLRGNYLLATLAAIFAATSGGFLFWNWPPAKIFLGDAGSGPIGYLIAGLALASENDRSAPLLAFAIMYGVFVVDATVTLIRRWRRGDRLAEAHRDHAYQRLTRAWGNHGSVTRWAAATTILLSVLGVAGTVTGRLLMPAVFVALVLLATLLIAVERRAPM